MKKKTLLATLALSLISSGLFVGCGESKNLDNSEGQGSNIPYLEENHANYKEHGSTQTPSPIKDANAKSIHWTISATTEEGASKLQEHIEFMEDKLLADKNPRAFDKLFLMEAYMKFNNLYSTSVERSSTDVVVSKNANTTCAYAVISAHSDVVSGDFFAQGDIHNDHSSTAEDILQSVACDSVRSDLSVYISQRQKTRK
jgi:hypothetical protein